MKISLNICQESASCWYRLCTQQNIDILELGYRNFQVNFRPMPQYTPFINNCLFNLCTMCNGSFTAAERFLSIDTAVIFFQISSKTLLHSLRVSL